MESTVVGIASIESKDINTAKGPGTLFILKDVVGTEYTTFDRELAVQAAALRGQNATIGFDITTNVKPNRQGVDTTYTNRYLKSLGAAGASQPSEHTFDPGVTPTPSVPVQAVTAPPTAPPTATPVEAAVIPTQSSHSDREESIARAVALKAAVDLASSGVLSASIADIIARATSFETYLLGRVEAETAKELTGVASSSDTGADDIPFSRSIDGLGN